MLRVADCVADSRPARHTTADRMAAHRKSDRRRDDLCAVGLRKPWVECTAVGWSEREMAMWLPTFQAGGT